MMATWKTVPLTLVVLVPVIAQHPSRINLLAARGNEYHVRRKDPDPTVSAISSTSKIGRNTFR